MAEFLAPTTVTESLEALGAEGSTPLAGGTALVQLLKQGLTDANRMVWLGRVADSLKERAKTLVDMVEQGRFYFEAPDVFNHAVLRFLSTAGYPGTRAAPGRGVRMLS